MNVFDIIHLNNDTPEDRAFAIAEAVLDIELARVEKEYAYESGLIEFDNGNTFCENTDAKSENIFVKAIKGIINAIGGFITAVFDLIGGLFKKHENLTEEDFKNSKTAKLKLATDVEAMGTVVDDETTKGIGLLGKITGGNCTDEEINSWFENAKERITKVAPTVLTIGGALSFNAILNMFRKKKKKATTDVEQAAVNGADDEKKQKQKKTVTQHIATLWKDFTTTVKGTGKTVSNWLDTEYSAGRREIENEEKQMTDAQRKNYEELRKAYAAGTISEESYLNALSKYGIVDKDIKAKRDTKMKELDAQKQQNIQAENLHKQAINLINDKAKYPNLSKGQRISFKTYVDKKFNEYKAKTINFEDYRTSISMNNLLKQRTFAEV